MKKLENYNSLNLDLHNFFMNSKTGLRLSNANITVLDTLVYYLGEKQIVSVKQITLAAHLRIDLKSLQKHLKKLLNSKVIFSCIFSPNSQLNPTKDGRRLTYFINNNFYGYSKKSIQEKIEIHKSLNDQYMSVEDREKEIDQKEKTYRKNFNNQINNYTKASVYF